MVRGLLAGLLDGAGFLCIFLRRVVFHELGHQVLALAVVTSSVLRKGLLVGRCEIWLRPGLKVVEGLAELGFSDWSSLGRPLCPQASPASPSSTSVDVLDQIGSSSRYQSGTRGARRTGCCFAWKAAL
jgi:hypothetical protein